MAGMGSALNDLIAAQLAKEQGLIEKPKYEFDRLKLYYGEEYKINDQITIQQPTVQDFIDLGEKNIYHALTPFLANPTTCRLSLWDMGFDWNKMSDFDLFRLMKDMVEPQYAKCVFPDLDLTQLQVIPISTEKFAMIGPNGLFINEEIYNHMAAYLRYMFNTFPKVETTKSKSMKEDLILEERINLQKRMREMKGIDDDSSLQLMISFCVNHPGFKYKKNELREVGIVEFMDSVQRLQVIESTTALFHGMYSGMLDVKKIDHKEFNFMRELTHA